MILGIFEIHLFVGNLEQLISFARINWNLMRTTKQP